MGGGGGGGGLLPSKNIIGFHTLQQADRNARVVEKQRGQVKEILPQTNRKVALERNFSMRHFAVMHEIKMNLPMDATHTHVN